MLAGGRGSSAAWGVDRKRGLLVAAQFAFAIVLLVGAGLLLRSFRLLNAVQPGFDTTHLLTMIVELPEVRYTNEAQIRNFSGEAVRQIEALPGVRGAAVGSATFSSLNGNSPNEKIVVEGRSITEDAERHERDLVSDGYFRVLGIPLRQGRCFSPADVHDSPPVAVINQTMARRFWPVQNPIGKRFKEVLPGLDGAWLTVVGIVQVEEQPGHGARRPIFSPAIRMPLRPSSASLAASRLPARLSGTQTDVRVPDRDRGEKVAGLVDFGDTWIDTATIEDQLEELDRPRRFQTGLLGAFAVAALIWRRWVSMG